MYEAESVRKEQLLAEDGVTYKSDVSEAWFMVGGCANWSTSNADM